MTSFLIDHPVRCSSQQVTAKTAKTMVRWAFIESFLWVIDRPRAEVGLGHAKALLDLPQLVIGAHHVLGGRRLKEGLHLMDDL
jgi:hypothetical protein